MNNHLNIFDFFNNHCYEYYEDNLSRAFALCLKYDTVVMDNVFKKVLAPELYASLFNTDYPDYSIQIDIQKRPKEITNFSNIIAISCSGVEIDINKMDLIQARDTEKPETDLCIEINDTCLIFEFKTTEEDCSAQLKCQALRIKENCPAETSIVYVDLNWKKIVKILLNVLSLQKQINTENPFTLDFVKFLEKKHPKWFPIRLLENIPFPTDDNTPNQYYLESRLNQIKYQVFDKEHIKEVSGRYYRYVGLVNWGWANEISIGSKCEGEKQYIIIKIYPGDTKAQGLYLFKSDNAIEWPDNINGYKLTVDPYLKFSHFNSGVCWYHPMEQEYKTFHTRSFFLKNSGRYTKDKWADFERLMESIAPKWREKCEYDQEIVNSNRTYFDLSIGIGLTVYIPYTDAQKMDKNEFDSGLAKELNKIIPKLKDAVDCK